MGQDFVGSGNNMNLLMPVGQFGSRTHGGSDAASVRYLFTQFSPWTSILFDSRDDSILCPGNPVPEFYVPILPMCLVNGGEGIGTGFSCKIPPFNPSDIKANILRILDRKPLEKMTPWFRGFRGKTTKIDDSSWLFEGTVTKMSAGKCRVTELPPGVWTQKFKESLEADQLKYENHSTDEAADFIVYSDELPIPHKVVHASNMHLITPSGIQKFDSAEHILFEYSKIRLKFYKSRKVNLIKVTNEKLEKLIQKSKFISCVMSESIKVFGRPIQEVKSDMDAMNLSHELLKTRIDEYTGEKLNELREQIEELTRVLSEITACTPADMWKKDLDRL
jgi:DNA topoisomerase-2